MKKIAIIGAGVIGTGWVIRLLAHNKNVIVYDKNPKLKKKIILEIKNAWPFIKKLFNTNKLALKNFKYVSNIEDALIDADLIQECAPENYNLKNKTNENNRKDFQTRRSYFIKFFRIIAIKNLFKMQKSFKNNSCSSF